VDLGSPEEEMDWFYANLAHMFWIVKGRKIKSPNGGGRGKVCWGKRDEKASVKGEFIFQEKSQK
jgi:hypothetical protein